MFDFIGWLNGFLGWAGQYILVWLAMLTCMIIGYIGGHSFGWTDGYGQAVRDNLAADHFRRLIERKSLPPDAEDES